MKTNTTDTIGIASRAFEKELEETKTNFDKKLAGLGIDKKNLTQVRIPRIEGSMDDVVVCSINAVEFYLKRGESYKLPDEIIAVLENGNIL